MSTGLTRVKSPYDNQRKLTCFEYSGCKGNIMRCKYRGGHDFYSYDFQVFEWFLQRVNEREQSTTANSSILKIDEEAQEKLHGDAAIEEEEKNDDTIMQ